MFAAVAFYRKTVNFKEKANFTEKTSHNVKIKHYVYLRGRISNKKNVNLTERRSVNCTDKSAF